MHVLKISEYKMSVPLTLLKSYTSVSASTFSGDRRASRCASHKLDGHVDITSRKCEFEGCSRIPSFRFHPTGSQEAKKGRVRFCAQHKQEGMQDYHQETRGCRFVAGAPGEEGQGVPCDRSSSFGFKGGKRTRCARHKEEGGWGWVDCARSSCLWGLPLLASCCGLPREGCAS